MRLSDAHSWFPRSRKNCEEHSRQLSDELEAYCLVRREEERGGATDTAPTLVLDLWLHRVYILLAHLLRILYLVAQEQADCLYALLRPVNVVSHEDVVTLRGETSGLKEPEEIIELAVGVATYMYRGRHLEEHGLGTEDLGSGGSFERESKRLMGATMIRGDHLPCVVN